MLSRRQEFVWPGSSLRDPGIVGSLGARRLDPSHRAVWRAQSRRRWAWSRDERRRALPASGRATPARGFTLLEVLLVLGILILLAAIVTPSLFNRQRKAMISTTRVSIVGLEGALRLYAAEHEGEYPVGSPSEVFAVLMNPGTGEDGQSLSPYVEKLPADAWGQTLYYEFPTTRHRRADKPAIWSAGPDQKNDNGANDDISNWDEVAK